MPGSFCFFTIRPKGRLVQSAHNCCSEQTIQQFFMAPTLEPVIIHIRKPSVKAFIRSICLASFFNSFFELLLKNRIFMGIIKICNISLNLGSACMIMCTSLDPSFRALTQVEASVRRFFLHEPYHYIFHSLLYYNA